MDQLFEAFVDKLCTVLPAWFRLLYVSFAHTHLGWRILLLVQSIGQGLQGMIGNVRSDSDMDLFLAEVSESLTRVWNRCRSGWDRRLGIFFALDNIGESCGFYTLLYALGLSALAVVSHAGKESAIIAAACCFDWLAAAALLRYRPITGNIRQIHLLSRFLRGFGFLLRLIVWFGIYLSNGIASNIVLQCMMLITLGLHLAVYLAVIAFNRKQNRLLRILDGLLGVFPALTASIAIVLLVSNMGDGLRANVIAATRMLGALLLFAADRMESVVKLGGIRFPFSGLVLFLISTLGSLLVIAAAWAA